MLHAKNELSLSYFLSYFLLIKFLTDLMHTISRLSNRLTDCVGV